MSRGILLIVHFISIGRSSKFLRFIFQIETKLNRDASVSIVCDVYVCVYVFNNIQRQSHRYLRRSTYSVEVTILSALYTVYEKQ